jgi:hypothetical protein
MKNIPYEQYKDIKELWAKHGGYQKGSTAEIAVISMDKLMEFVEAVRRLGMTTDDGGYMCVPDHALEVAQMISNCESIFTGEDTNFEDGYEITDALKDYLNGEKSCQEVNAVAKEIHEEIARAQARREAKKAAADLLTPDANK